MNQSNRSAALAAVIALVLIDSARAQSAPALGPVLVTANRIETPAEQALASVTVLTRADIELSQAPDLLDLLGRQAGIDIARSGGPGQASTVFMRGSNSNHTLVLIDGIRVNAATQGIIDFAHLPLAQIERIEIVRGPRAALWGSDAIGGVIHIFTRDPSKAFLEARAGSYRRAGFSAGTGVASGESRLGVAVGREELRGFSATNAGAFGYDPDADGYRNRNLSLRAQTTLGEQRLAFSGLLTDASVEFDQGQTAALNRVFGLSLGGSVAPRWSHGLSLGHSSEDLATAAFASRFGSTRDSLDWLHTLALDSDNTLNVGINWSREGGYSDADFRRSRRNAALFASWRGRFGDQLFEASLRRDDNSQFQGASTANLAWGWQATQALHLRASWGQGFRAPNFNELYYPGFDAGDGLVLFAGNADLQPERSSSSELGLDWQLAADQRLGLSLFRTRISQLIAFDGALFQAVNIHRAAIDGAELQYHLSRGPLAIDANAGWLDARDADSGLPLLRRPARKLQMSAGWLLANLAALGVEAAAVSARQDFGGRTLPGYGRLDARVSAPLAHGWTLEARLENLLDRDYELVGGYNTPGRSGLLNLRWNGE